MQATGIAHFGLLFSLSLFTNPGHAVTISDLLISEVMANPAALSDARGEWFELYNPTSEAINLREIIIGDDANDRHRIESDLLILPGAAGSFRLAVAAVPLPATVWLFVSGLLALFSLTSRSSRYVGPPRKRRYHNLLSKPTTTLAARAS